MQKDITWLLKEKYNGHENATYFADVKRLKSGEPLAYVIGHIPFLDTTIYLDDHPLIPRTETEFWVNNAIQSIKSNVCASEHKLEILDIFSGSGCIGVSLLKHLCNSSVTFAEIDPTLVSTIQKNINENIETLDNRYKIVTSDVFENITKSFDYIFANPPYISKANESDVETSVQDYEPHLALYAENNGLELIKRLLREAPNYLKPNGTMYIEIGYDQEDLIRNSIDKELPEIYTSKEFQKDQYERSRVVKLTV